MVNEDLITSLKNAVDHGESLDSAMQSLISAGYNPVEVRESSKFVGASPDYLDTKPEEHLLMPESKTFIKPISRPVIRASSQLIRPAVPLPPISPSHPIPFSPIRPRPQFSQFPQYKNSSQDSLSSQLNEIKPAKERFSKEIILLVVLLLLIGFLFATVVFKDKILALLTG